MVDTAAYFVPDDGGLMPVPQASSPWAADMLHGRLLAGLAARAVADDADGSDLRLARLTVDMFRTPPMAPYSVATEVVRSGRRVRAVDVSIESDGVEVARARSLMLRAEDQPDVSAWRPPNWDVPPPETLPPPMDASAGGGWDIRLTTPGGFWTSDRKRLWMRDTWQLVAGEDLSPIVRAALAADLPNPLANSGAEGLAFINPDLTLYLARVPASDWIGLEVTDHISSEGIAVGTCRLYDITGPIGTSTVSAMVNRSTLG